MRNTLLTALAVLTVTLSLSPTHAVATEKKTAGDGTPCPCLVIINGHWACYTPCGYHGY